MYTKRVVGGIGLELYYQIRALKDYLIKFNGNEVSFLSWRELVKTMDIKGDKLDQIYTYFSLYAHPSNVAVFQFANMFGKGESAYKSIVIFNLQTETKNSISLGHLLFSL